MDQDKAKYIYCTNMYLKKIQYNATTACIWYVSELEI